MWYSRVSKLATSPISKRFTNKSHPTLNQNASFSSLVDLKSPSTSSKNGYNYPKNLLLLKHCQNSGVDKRYENILETPKRTSKYYQQELVSSARVGLESLKTISFLLFSVLTCFVTLGVYKCSEKIPYTNRTHIVVAPPFWEKMIGDIVFERVQLSTLSEEHPDSLRVKMIGEKIVEALESDLKAMKNHQNVSVDHLVGYKWKFIVADDPSVTALNIPGGKIFVYTGLLKELESDAEIATIIGHEVGHHVARHLAETNNMRMLVSNTRAFFGLPESKLKFSVHSPKWIIKWIKVLFQYPKCRRQESEADDIGLLVMASAGYDPQVAPKVYEIIQNNSSPGNKRTKELARGEVMKEASSIYSKVIGTRKMNGLKDH